MQDFKSKIEAAKLRKQKRAKKAKLLGTRREKEETGNPEFVSWIRSLPCCCCGKPPPSHAHHSVHRSQSGGDETCVPLCMRCHGDYHDRLGSVSAMEKKWGVNLLEVSKKLGLIYFGIPH